MAGSFPAFSGFPARWVHGGCRDVAHSSVAQGAGRRGKLVGRGGRPEVFTYGHRNPQGLAWHPETGDLFISEHGPSGERGWRAHDEINVIVPGANYGWPEVVGAPGDSRFADPLVYWQAGLPPAGMTFWDGSNRDGRGRPQPGDDRILRIVRL